MEVPGKAKGLHKAETKRLVPFDVETDDVTDELASRPGNNGKANGKK
jgi:hypothetical protein